ncbi:hypothetical protein C8035_v002693 [Colletotrichum spinosum]|uniref:Uncharacterized protein n=1 Tax=Colletotrichum spinosum TaxID=1347390 RepID=A0A4R8PXM0_9PEZI|nr:hypothetical protein C8035_v002693 [Colletotrichum spinosum]
MAAYPPGRQLELRLHANPSRPYGAFDYPWPDDEHDLRLGPRGVSIDLTSDEREAEAVIEVVRPLVVKSGAQILLCKVIQAPSDSDQFAAWPGAITESDQSNGDPSYLVAKVFDYKLYSKSRDVLSPPFSNATLADIDLSCESAAYRGLFKPVGKLGDTAPTSKLTGHPNLAPEYYGTWLIDVQKRNHDSFDPQRFVGTVPMEYIEGETIEDICTRDPDSGDLVLPPGEVRLHDGPEGVLDLGMHRRMLTIKHLLHGLMVQLHHAIYCTALLPRNVMITRRNNGKAIPIPRPVLIDYTWYEVYDYTRMAATGHAHFHRKLDLPGHPAEVYGPEELPDFAGWVPSRWIHEAYVRPWPPGGFLFDKWMLKAFGPKEEGPKYSIFETVRSRQREEQENREQEQERETEREREREAEQ